ncbi:MAG: hypothetical protein CMH54_11195 [Myxococcales bacterium]|nr:hypothetical protein [Myxococcales bacterium]
MGRFELYTEQLSAPAVVIHGGAGNYLETTTEADRLARGRVLLDTAHGGMANLGVEGPRAAVLASVMIMESDVRFNAGLGSKLQRDGMVRVSAALMSGRDLRLSAVYNVGGCLHPSELANILHTRGDRNLDGEGAAQLMHEMGIDTVDLRTPQTIERWRSLIEKGEEADMEGAIGDSGLGGLERARAAGLDVPENMKDLPPEGERYGTVGAVAVGEDGELWACTSTGGRGHEHPGRVSDTPTPAGTYACSRVAISATGFGEQIMELNVTGRIATRILDGKSLHEALDQTFQEVVAHQGALGVIAVTDDGWAGYAYSTDACGVAWVDGAGSTHIDPHGRSEAD